MIKIIIYIAGAITGVFDYRKKFKKAEQELTSMGHIVINPSLLPNGLNNYMPICMAMIDQADAVYFLKGSSSSVGAMQALRYCEQIGTKIIDEYNDF